MQDTITRALNRVVASMRSVAHSPEIVSEVRRPQDLEALGRTAEKEQAVLQQRNLVVELTPYD